LGKTSGLTPELVRGEQVVQAFRKVELNTYHYGLSTRGLLTLMANRGPSYLHAVTASETAVLKANDVFSQTMRFPYVFVFPAEGTFWSDNPFCIPDADWVSAEQREAAGLYRDYLLQPAQQDMAVTIGLRPVNSAVTLHAPISLDKGTDPRVSPQTVLPLAPVSGDTAAAIRDVFHLTKKKATVAILLDTSNSMTGDKIKNTVEATTGFLKGLDKDDRVTVYAFSNSTQELQPAGRAGDVAESLSQTLKGLQADTTIAAIAWGNTALYDSICQAVESVATAREADRVAGEKRLYGVVVLSDGADTASHRTQNQMFDCLPSGEDVEGIKVFTIAYGSDANQDLLGKIADHTNGKTFVGDPKTIGQVYLAISAEQ
jgi:Ca-activated chloride channel family protein